MYVWKESKPKVTIYWNVSRCIFSRVRGWEFYSAVLRDGLGDCVLRTSISGSISAEDGDLVWWWCLGLATDCWAGNGQGWEEEVDELHGG
jgi:hypothetical protein